MYHFFDIRCQVDTTGSNRLFIATATTYFSSIIHSIQRITMIVYTDCFSNIHWIPKSKVSKYRLDTIVRPSSMFVDTATSHIKVSIGMHIGRRELLDTSIPSLISQYPLDIVASTSCIFILITQHPFHSKVRSLPVDTGQNLSSPTIWTIQRKQLLLKGIQI